MNALIQNDLAAQTSVAEAGPSPYQLLSRHRTLLLIYTAAILFDTVSTIHFMVRDGICLELHPLVRVSSYYYGPVLGPVLFAFLFKLFAGLILLFYFKHYARYILRTASAIAFVAGLYNFIEHPPIL